MFLLRRLNSKKHNTNNDAAKREGNGCSSQASCVVEEEAAANKTLDQASKSLRDGKYEKALWLLEKARQIYPSIKGLLELIAIAEVCYAATWRSCTCLLRQRRSPDWYKILQVDENSDAEAIKKRYRQLALLLHPDKNKHVKAEGAFKLVSEAYACLSDKKKRVIFNAERSTLHCKQCSLVQPASTDLYRERVSKLWRPNSDSNLNRAECTVREPKLWRPSSDSGLNHPEWVAEQEKLKVFQDRARARVSALVKAWKQRRSKWMEEYDLGRDRDHSKKVDKKIWPCKDVQTDNVLWQKHQRVWAQREKRQGTVDNRTESECDISSRVASSSSYISERSYQSFAPHNLMENSRPQRSPQELRPKSSKNLVVLIQKLRADLEGNASSSIQKEDEFCDGEKFRQECSPHISEFVESQQDATSRTQEHLQTRNEELEHRTRCAENLCEPLMGNGKIKFKVNKSSGVATSEAASNLKTGNINFIVENLQPTVVMQDTPCSLTQENYLSSDLRNLGDNGSCADRTSFLSSFVTGADKYRLHNSTSKMSHSFTKGPQDKRSENSRVLHHKDSVEASESCLASNHAAPRRFGEWASDAAIKIREKSTFRVDNASAKDYAKSEFSNQKTVEIINHVSPRDVKGTMPLSTNTSEKSASRNRSCRGDSLDLEETILQTQKQKSEALLKSLERLREEAKSVAVTLDKLRQTVEAEDEILSNCSFHKFQMTAVS